MKQHQKEIRKFYYLINDLNIKEQKENLISGYGVDSIKDLSVSQLQELNGGLLKIQHKRNKVEVSPEIRAKRSVVINLLEQLGIYKGKHSWPKVNSFLDKPKIAGKQMYQMDLDELVKLSKKLRAMIEKDNKKIKKENSVAKYN